MLLIGDDKIKRDLQMPSLLTQYLRMGHPRVLAMLFLGFSAGLPLLLIFSTLLFGLVRRAYSG